MRGKRGLLLAVAILLVFGIFAFQGADIETYAKGTTSKWTVTTSKKTYAYTGKKIKPKVTVKYKGKKLKPKNYKITYPKNPVKPGKYKIKVTLKGKYKGKKIKGSKTIEYSVALPTIKGLKSTFYRNDTYGDTLDFDWNMNSATMKMDGYELEVRNNGTIGDKVTKKKIETYYSGFYLYVSEYGITYTFRIRTYKKIGGKTYYSKWSKVTKKIPIPDYHMTTKTVNGIDLAYKTDEFPFFKYTDYANYNDEANKISKDFAQCYFPIFIKQKLKNDVVIHTEYNGKCGFNSFSNTQYIPDRKNVQVATNISVVYYDEMPVRDKMQQTLYKQGYIGYILVNVSCLLDKKQSVDVYFGDTKVVTLVSNGFSNSVEFDRKKYWEYDPFLEPVYNYDREVRLKGILKDVAQCAPDMTDYETYTALNYWIGSHSYSEYTCWGAATVANAMTELGYPYIILSCSYDGENGFYNDYSRYYSAASKKPHNVSGGHVVTLIFMGQGKFVECEVQGYASDSSEFKFDPTGWHKPTYSTLTSASCKFALNEYNTIEELMKGDYYVDINKYDPYDWHTWSTHLE